MKIQNVEELREQLSEVLFALKTKRMLPNLGKEINNSAGKIMQSVKLELEYASQRKEKPEVGFLRMTKGAK